MIDNFFFFIIPYYLTLRNDAHPKNVAPPTYPAHRNLSHSGYIYTIRTYPADNATNGGGGGNGRCIIPGVI